MSNRLKGTIFIYSLSRPMRLAALNEAIAWTSAARAEELSRGGEGLEEVVSRVEKLAGI